MQVFFMLKQIYLMNFILLVLCFIFVALFDFTCFYLFLDLNLVSFHFGLFYLVVLLLVLSCIIIAIIIYFLQICAANY